MKWKNRTDLEKGDFLAQTRLVKGSQCAIMDGNLETGILMVKFEWPIEPDLVAAADPHSSSARARSTWHRLLPLGTLKGRRHPITGASQAFEAL